MKLSELIKELQSHLEEFGDLDTYLPNEYGAFLPVEFISDRVMKWDEEYLNPLTIGIVIES